MATNRVERPRYLTFLGPVAAALLVLAGCSSSSSNGNAPTTTTASDAAQAAGPPNDPPQTIDTAKVDAAVRKFGPIAQAAMHKTGVPGISVAIVFDGKVISTKGYGVRKVGTTEKVDANTVFQLASLSKPIGATVMSTLVGDGKISWNEPIHKVDPNFALADPWVTDHVTFADMYSHRSGLPDHAGDLMEDVGFDRTQILDKLRYFPLSPFRATYAYTNFGLTEAATAAASTTGESWADLSAKLLYKPLGMSRTSSRYADFEKATNRVVPHVRIDGKWVAKYHRDPDAQSPAGGVSSDANDMAKWLNLQIGNGTVNGHKIVDAKALEETRVPHSVSSPPSTPTARTSFYGLGTGISYDDQGRTEWSHSGAFALGASTAYGILANEKLGIAVLTNGMPVGLPEALVADFFDLASQGKLTRDWLAGYSKVVEANLYPEPEVDYTKPPAHAKAARDDAAYLGTYTSDIYGPLVISRAPSGDLQLVVGPDKVTLALHHYDGDTFWIQGVGENAGPPSAVVFDVGSDGTASKVSVKWLDGATPGVGTFTR